MSAKTISHVQGKGSIAHNNRLFSPKNVDSSRTVDNICYISQPIAEAYAELFDKAVEEYNATQKRSDRKIKNGYYEHLFNRSPCNTVVESANGQKSFYEDVVQIGTKDDTGVNSADADLAKFCLDEYMKSFQKRNPNFHVFNAVLHMDEATPHLHIDYIPVGHYNRGVPVQNGLAQALKEMGYGGGKDAINRWRQSERKILKEICIVHGLEIADETLGRGYSMKVEEYKEHQDKIHAYEEREAELEKEIQPLLEAKAVADSVSVSGVKMPLGNSRIVSENEFEAINIQKKALAVQEKTVKAKNAHLDKERFYTDMKEQKLNERAENLNEREKSLDDREIQIAKKEKSVEAKVKAADELYEKQIDINTELDKVSAENKTLKTKVQGYIFMQMKMAELESTLNYTKQKLDESDEKHIQERERELQKLSEQHKSELAEKDTAYNALSSELTSTATELERVQGEHTELKKQYGILQSLMDVLYEVGRYFGRKLGIDFDKAVDMRIDKWSFSHIFNNGRER